MDGDTDLGLFTAGPTCGAANITAPGLWYVFTGTGQDVTLSTCGQAAYDSKISVFSGPCNALVCEAGNDDGPGCTGNTSILTFFAASGVDHHVLVHGYNANTGTFTLSMSCAAPCADIPENDACATAEVILPQSIGNCIPTAGTNVCAYGSALPNPPCDPYANIIDVWYLFNSGPDPDHTIDLMSTGANGLNMAIYAACGTPTYIDCFMDVNAPVELSGLTLNTDYYLRVWNGGGTNAGGFTICDEAALITALPAQSYNRPHAWPVPAQERLFISGISPTCAGVEVYDPLGRPVLKRAVAPHNGICEVDISGLAAGSYLLLLPYDTGSSILRFVVE